MVLKTFLENRIIGMIMLIIGIILIIIGIWMTPSFLESQLSLYLGGFCFVAGGVLLFSGFLPFYFSSQTKKDMNFDLLSEKEKKFWQEVGNLRWEIDHWQWRGLEGVGQILEKVPKGDLEQFCEKNDLETSGTKKQIIRRILTSKIDIIRIMEIPSKPLLKLSCPLLSSVVPKRRKKLIERILDKLGLIERKVGRWEKFVELFLYGKVIDYQTAAILASKRSRQFEKAIVKWIQIDEI